MTARRWALAVCRLALLCPQFGRTTLPSRLVPAGSAFAGPALPVDCAGWQGRRAVSTALARSRANAAAESPSRAVDLVSCLRLRGGKIKYKDLKVVKKAREEGLKVKGEHRPPKPRHRAGTKVKDRANMASAPVGETPKDKRGMLGKEAPGREVKVRGGKKARKKASVYSGDSDDALTGANAGIEDRMGMEDWAAKGENIYYGGESDPSDSEELMEQWEMEEDEVRRMDEIRRQDLHGAADPKLAAVENNAFNEYPSDSVSSEGVGPEHAAKSAGKAAGKGVRLNKGTGSAYLDFVFQGNASLVNTPQGLALLVGEMETAMQTLRSSVEPLLLRCRVFQRRESLQPAETLLVEKYRALLCFVLGVQDKVTMTMRLLSSRDKAIGVDNGGRGHKAPGSGQRARREAAAAARVHLQLDSNWYRLLDILKFEEALHQDIRELLVRAATLPPPPAHGALALDQGEAGPGMLAEYSELEDVLPMRPGGASLKGTAAGLHVYERERREEAAMEVQEQKELEQRMKMLHMVEDDEVALKYGHKWWYQKYAAALRLEEDAANGKTLNEEQLNKIERKGYMHAMWRRAYRLTFPEIRGDPRKPTGGDTVIMEGGRRPVPLEILLNVRGTMRKHRSRKDSNPRIRLRHRYHDLLVRSRGSVRTMRTGDRASYSGEASGINPKAKHGKDMAWNKMQKNAKQQDKKAKASGAPRK